ncbi:MAG: S-layer homology domain-containing protein [Clostridia bacterium]|nr:S-layer homology domain-containing protein [Clostridia bacterium]
MIKRMLCLLMGACLVLSQVSRTSAAGDMDNFTRSYAYEEPFADVAEDAWYAPYVQAAYEYGFVAGKGEGLYDPDGNITLAETLVIASNLHSTFYDEEIPRAEDGPWYQTYADYAVETGIIWPGDYEDYTQTATRAQFAAIMAEALPSYALEELASVRLIPDVPAEEDWAAPIYRLYNAGILSGSDEYGTFRPNANIRRSEVAAVALNMAEPERRQAPILRTEQLTLYADDGRTLVTTRGQEGPYLARGWQETPVEIPAGSTPEQILNSAVLDPMKTNDEALDAMIDEIFAEILSEGMSTYEQVKACYDWIIAHAEYDYIGGRSYAGIFVYEAYRDSVVVSNAKHILTTGRGVCDDYSSAFQVMTRRIGLKSYFCQGQTYDQQGGISPHQVCIVEIGGKFYLFDPQIEDYNAKGRPHPYERFCRTFAEMPRYYGYDPAAAKAAFGGFVRK